jgi:hypothetical protein
MESVTVRIVGATDAWQRAADYARRRLRRAFGPQVQVAYYTASSPEINRFPQALALVRLGNALLPLVFIGDELFSTGGKILIPEISRRLETLGVPRDPPVGA